MLVEGSRAGDGDGAIDLRVVGDPGAQQEVVLERRLTKIGGIKGIVIGRPILAMTPLAQIFGTRSGGFRLISGHA